MVSLVSVVNSPVTARMRQRSAGSLMVHVVAAVNWATLVVGAR